MMPKAQHFEYAGRDLEAMSFARNYHRWILDEFRPYIRGFIAEIGAGTGSFSDLLMEMPHTRYLAVEPSDRMFSLLKEYLGSTPDVTLHNGFFGDVSGTYAGEIDTSVYVNVLEHVEHDRDELRLVFASLRKGGHVCIFVPALPMLYSDFDKSIGHFRRYTKKSLVDVVQSAGFEVVKVRYFDLLGTFAWFILLKLLKRRLGGSEVSWYDRGVVPVMRRFERLVPLPLGKNVLLVARKPE